MCPPGGDDAGADSDGLEGMTSEEDPGIGEYGQGDFGASSGRGDYGGASGPSGGGGSDGLAGGMGRDNIADRVTSALVSAPRENPFTDIDDMDYSIAPSTIAGPIGPHGFNPGLGFNLNDQTVEISERPAEEKGFWGAVNRLGNFFSPIDYNKTVTDLTKSPVGTYVGFDPATAIGLATGAPVSMGLNALGSIADVDMTPTIGLASVTGPDIGSRIGNAVDSIDTGIAQGVSAGLSALGGPAGGYGSNPGDGDAYSPGQGQTAAMFAAAPAQEAAPEEEPSIFNPRPYRRNVWQGNTLVIPPYT